MGKNSHISWTDNTFNPFWGCTKVSDGCKLCYAQTLANRWGFDIWGNDKSRRFFGEKHWQEPVTWNKQAIEKGITQTVFCGSMCDIFEDRDDLIFPRHRLWQLIAETSALTWLLLTKRPEYVRDHVPTDWLADRFPENVWLGVTVENQNYLHRLEKISNLSVKRFVSVEPMLDYVDFGSYWWAVDWCIIGGESGAGSRFMQPLWALQLVNECKARSVPVFVKQLGGFPDKQDRIEEWPESLQIQQFPEWEQKERLK